MVHPIPQPLQLERGVHSLFYLRSKAKDGKNQGMKVTLYTRESCVECRRVWDMLAKLAPAEGITLQESPSPDGAPSPCIRFGAPGNPFYRAENLTVEQLKSYLDDARRLVQERDAVAAQSPVRRAGAPPTAQFERAHPIRSFLWRHRVGGVVSAISLYLGLAWLAPLTVLLGLGNGIYNAIHSAYRIFCDQIPERSASIGGLPVSLCWRCTAIFAGSLLFGALYTVGRDRKLGWLDWLKRPISLPMLILYVLPLTLDGISHAAGWRSGISDAYSSDFWLSWSTFSADWWLRILTSALAAIGAVKFLCPRLDKLGIEYERLYRARRVPATA